MTESNSINSSEEIATMVHTMKERLPVMVEKASQASVQASKIREHLVHVTDALNAMDPSKQDEGTIPEFEHAVVEVGKNLEHLEQSLAAVEQIFHATRMLASATSSLK